MSFTYLLFCKLRTIRTFFHISLPSDLRSIVLDILDMPSRKESVLIAPLRIRHTLGQDKEYDGAMHVQSLRDLCGLKPYEKILDVGSGCGRIALSLTKYLNKNGSYDGLEIVKEFVDWCQANINIRYPNFKFAHANIYNSSYNPGGLIKASKYHFPYEDCTFDVVVLSSVFTHMLPDDLDNYLSEIARVLKRNGRCWISYFLLDSEAQRFTNSNHTIVNFIDMGGYFVADLAIPENAVAYQEVVIKKLYEKYSLKILQPIHYGSGGQDLIIAIKE